MQAHLKEIFETVAKGAQALLRLNQAGWHTAQELHVPENLTLVFLPSHGPESSPVENILRYVRQHWLSTLVFDAYEAVIAACEACNDRIKQPKTITSIGLREWAHTGQS